jgi:transcriptional regulator with XRE-family HTH domain
MTYDYERGTVLDYEELDGEPPIGQFIRQSRQDRLMTQSELARRAGVSRTHLGGIEHCKSEPSYRVVKALCQVLGVEPWQTWEPMQDTEAIDRLRVIQEHTQKILEILHESSKES